MQQTMDEMGRSAFPVRPGETFHMKVSYSAYYLALITQAGGLYGRILTEVKILHTDRLSLVNKMFIIWHKQELFNSFNVTDLHFACEQR